MVWRLTIAYVLQYFVQYLFALALILKKNALFLYCTGTIENV